MTEKKTLEQWEEDAMQIINLLAPVTRRDTWWGTDWCRSMLADELKRMYGEESKY